MASVDINNENEEAEKLQSQEYVNDGSKRISQMQEEIDKDLELERKLSIAGLQRSRRLFGGLFKDLKRKGPFYLSDFKDVLALKCVASVIFIYFAGFALIVTFGGLLGVVTDHRIGTIESIISGFICGLLYCMFSGQPLTILNGAGSILVFEAIAYSICKQYDFDYLSFRLWIGIWTSLLLNILVAFDCSVVAKYITHFTTDIYIAFMALIVIYSKIIKFSIQLYAPANKDHNSLCNGSNESEAIPYEYLSTTNDSNCTDFRGPLMENSSETNPTEISLISTLLFVFTFLISFGLKQSNRIIACWPTKIMEFLSDFAVPTAIASMVAVDFLFGWSTPKLYVPTTLMPTWSGRNWFISPFGYNPWWTYLMAIIPALLLTVIIFIEQHVTAVIVNQEENKLKKGGGYHMDVFVLSCLILISSLLGLPWIIPSMLISINHVNSLKKFTATSGKLKLLGVIEQRVTSLLACILIGVSIFFLPLLRIVPVSVMDGVMIYICVTCLQNLNLVQRIFLIFIPITCRPKYEILRKMPLKRVHLFTFIQLLCMVFLWVVKSFIGLSIIFSLMILILMGIRWGLHLIFSSGELKLLDNALVFPSEKSDFENQSKIAN